MIKYILIDRLDGTQDVIKNGILRPAAEYARNRWKK